MASADQIKPVVIDQNDNIRNWEIAKSLFTPPTWTTPTLLNSWVNFGSGFCTTQFCKDTLGTVFVKGHVKNGTLGANIFVLPTNYQPSLTMDFVQGSNGAYGQIRIDNTGAVYQSVHSGSNASQWLNFSFKAEE